MRPHLHPLDNAIWDALGGPQSRFAQDGGDARRFIPEVSPLAAIRDARSPASWQALSSLIPPQQFAGLFLWDLPASTGALAIVRSILLVNMVCLTPPADIKSAPEVGEDLGAADVDDMIALVKLTEPGPMERRTLELGHYLGVRDAVGNLIAMAGERMRVPGFTEISAVCTHPQHRGKGLARDLMKRLMAEVIARGETPMLHAAAANTNAQQLYHQLGFHIRKIGHMLVLGHLPGSQ